MLQKNLLCLDRKLFYPIIQDLSGFFWFVEKPKGRYKGHDPKREVPINTTATNKPMSAIVPERTPVKYRIPIRMAIRNRIPLSHPPIFFFIVKTFTKDQQTRGKQA